jgi:(1->4)-alpha-D-glucan 1-alpha-D-glucosylmutase
MTLPSGIPRATYRLQFHQNFGFQEAARIAPYLQRLGISHVYASPIFRASPGSSHGYDICDHNALNPELGTEKDFLHMVGCLRSNGLSLLVDFVPNHMSVSDPANRWWRSVLQHGPASPYAAYFDVEWTPPKTSMKNRVLLPVLADQYGHELQSGQIRLKAESGQFFVVLPDKELPVCPNSLRPVLEHAAGLLPTPPPELLSIIAAVTHLPTRDCKEDARRQERLRETEIIHRRLETLCAQDADAEQAVQDATRAWGPESGSSGLDRLDELLSQQAYRLSYWRVAAEEINYRRFFDIDTLAGIRMELREVFDATHHLLLSLVADGSISGIRLDHIDGLARPDLYLCWLREAVDARTPAGVHFPIYVEKILTGGELLPSDWDVDGTTGYEFANAVTRLLVDPEGESLLTRCDEETTGIAFRATSTLRECRKLIMDTSLSGEINMLGAMLARLADSHRAYRDFTLNALTRAIREVIAEFPVYRTYLRSRYSVREEDGISLANALRAAQRNNPASEGTVFAFLRRILVPSDAEEPAVDEGLREAFVLKFQQCSSPVTAKGVEDTALYRITRLLALNEVGGDPRSFAVPPEDFHQLWKAPLLTHPHNLLATSTHDTKRSEDVRARLAAISECPARWCRSVARWRAINAVHKDSIDGRAVPDAREEYYLYQTLAGTWPLEEMNSAAFQEYKTRICDHVIKACREAKLNSSWIEPQETWEQGITAFIHRILAPVRSGKFLPSFKPFMKALQQLGTINSLTQQVLKLTLPGVPDIYQGTEMWDYSLVDPDNRRPVDFERRIRMLEDLDAYAPPPLSDEKAWSSGLGKLWVTSTLLNLRRTHPELFGLGIYQDISARGEFAKCCLAFRRHYEKSHLLVIVPRLSCRVGTPPVGAAWQDTQLELPLGDLRWRNVLGPPGEAFQALPLLSQVLKEFPAAVLISHED